MKKSLILAVALLFASQAHASLQELIQGVKDNNQEKVLQLLNNGENVNAVNELGNSALHYAVALNNAEMTKILLQHGADMNISNAKGWSPLKIVEKKKVEDVAAVMLAAKNAAEAKAVAPEQVEAAVAAAAAEKVIEPIKETVAEANETATETAKAATAIVEEKAAVAVEAVKPTVEQVKSVAATVAAEKVVEPAKAAAEEINEAKVEPAKEVAVAVAEEKVIEPAKEAAAVVEEVKPAAVEEVAAEPVREVVTIIKETVSEPSAQADKNSNLTVEDAEKLFLLIDQAKLALLEAKKAQEKAVEQNSELQTQLKQLQAQNEDLTKRVAKYESAEKVAEAAKQEAEKAAKEKAVKAAQEAAAKKALLEKNAPKPVAKKPVYKPRVSDIDRNLFAGDEEIVYCLSYLGNGENSGMRRAAAHFAATAGIAEARYNQIAQMADAYFQSADTIMLQSRSNQCAGVITPSDTAKQNQIIRSLNTSIGDIVIIK